MQGKKRVARRRRRRRAVGAWEDTGHREGEVVEGHCVIARMVLVACMRSVAG